MHQIVCKVCGSDHNTPQPKTTHCNICRALRDMLFIADVTKKCFACGDKFAPVNRKDPLCSKCDYPHSIHGHGTCGICKAEDTSLMREDIAICLACMRKPGKTRATILRSLKRKQDQRLADPIRLERQQSSAEWLAECVAAASDAEDI